MILTKIVNSKGGEFAMDKLEFEEVGEEELFAEYTAECSGERSDCCTRVCTRNCGDDDDDDNDEEDSAESWGVFLELAGGVIQY